MLPPIEQRRPLVYFLHIRMIQTVADDSVFIFEFVCNHYLVYGSVREIFHWGPTSFDVLSFFPLFLY